MDVRLGRTVDGSIAASICALVERGALLRPEIAEGIEASIVLRFTEGHPSVRVDFRGDEIEICDDPDFDTAHDLAVEGALPDVIALIASPLAGGLPKPTSSAGRAALARLADGRVELDGPLRLGREFLRLLSVAPQRRRAGAPRGLPALGVARPASRASQAPGDATPASSGGRSGLDER